MSHRHPPQAGSHQVIHIHPQAPAKPAVGQACNGCGVCCLAEPCPVGMLVSWRRHGACKALAWSNAQQRYRCSLLLSHADRHFQPRLQQTSKRHAPQPHGPANARAWWLTSWLTLHRWGSALWRPWAARMISAGSGCDASLEVIPPSSELPAQDHASRMAVNRATRPQALPLGTD